MVSQIAADSAGRHAVDDGRRRRGPKLRGLAGAPVKPIRTPPAPKVMGEVLVVDKKAGYCRRLRSQLQTLLWCLIHKFALSGCFSFLSLDHLDPCDVINMIMRVERGRINKFNTHENTRENGAKRNKTKYNTRKETNLSPRSQLCLAHFPPFG